MKQGWIKLHRKLLENEELMRDPTALVVFFWILLSVNHKTGELKVGRFIAAEATRLKPTTYYGATKRLEKMKIITQNSNNKYTTIKVLNWHKYQGNDDNKLTTNRQQTDTYTRSKELKNIRKDLFVTFWEIYPKRNGKKLLKKQAFEYFIKNIKEKDFDSLLVATKNYSQSQQARDNYAKDAIRWLRNWEEWVEPEQEKQENEATYGNALKCYKKNPGCTHNTEPLCKICALNRISW